MALLFTEGFDWTTTIADTITYLKWGDRSSCSIGNTSGTLRFGAGSGNYLQFGTSRADFIRRPIGQNLATGVLGAAVRFATSGGGLYKTNIMILFDTTASIQCGLLLNNDLTISVYRGTTATILGTTASAINPDQWYYLEWKFKVDNATSSGDIKLYLDGTEVLSLGSVDSQNTANAYATHYCFGGTNPSLGTSGNANWWVDDHYLCDLTGGVNDSHIGNVRIQTLFPNGNGNSSVWTGSDGNSVNNYQQVDETALATADYNDGVSVGDKDTYTFTDTLSTTTVIYGIGLNFVGLRTDATARSVKVVTRHSGTDYDSSDVSLNTTGTNHQVTQNVNPGTSSGWTKTDIDAAEFGAKVSV